MILEIYTLLHVIISLIGIFSGLVVLFGTALRQTSRWLDEMVPDHHRVDERDRLFLSVPWFYASHWRRHHFALSAGRGSLRALSAPTRRALALDLRRHGCDRSLLECICCSRAGVRKSASLEGDGSRADRAAI